MLIKSSYFLGKPILGIRFFKGQFTYFSTLILNIRPLKQCIFFSHSKNGILLFSEWYYIYFHRRTCSHLLFDKLFRQQVLSLFLRTLAGIHSLNGTVHFSGVKICSGPILPMHFLSAYFRTPVIVKQTYYRSSYISRAALIIMKSEIFAERFFFRIPSCLDTFSNQLLLEDQYFFSTATVSDEHFLQNK